MNQLQLLRQHLFDCRLPSEHNNRSGPIFPADEQTFFTDGCCLLSRSRLPLRGCRRALKRSHCLVAWREEATLLAINNYTVLLLSHTLLSSTPASAKTGTDVFLCKVRLRLSHFRERRLSKAAAAAVHDKKNKLAAEAAEDFRGRVSAVWE